MEIWKAGQDAEGSVGIELDRVPVRVTDVEAPASSLSSQLHSRLFEFLSHPAELFPVEGKPQVAKTSVVWIKCAPRRKKVDEVVPFRALQAEHPPGPEDHLETQGAGVEALGGSKVTGP